MAGETITSLLLEPLGGIAGDMTIAAILQLGVDPHRLKTALASLKIKGLDFETKLESRHGIQGLHFRPLLKQKSGPSKPKPDATNHQGRAAAELLEVLDQSQLEKTIKQQSRAVLQKLAAAEGRVHGISPEKVIFHELGGWDTLVDIVSVCVGLAALKVSQVYCATVPLGSGWVNTAHGRMPIPAPATLELMQGFLVSKGGPEMERTTPTGAAILAALARPIPQPFVFTPIKIGWGVGSTHHPDFPNVLRAILCQSQQPAPSIPQPALSTPQPAPDWQEETITCAQTNLDNANPEWLGWLMEKLFQAGALDVTYSPLQMKKNRPGTLLQIWYPPQKQQEILAIVFTESSTLGIRYQHCQRAFLNRTSLTLNTKLGKIKGKLIHWQGQNRFTPEFEACRQLALTHQLPLPEIYAQAQQAFLKQQK